MTKQIFTFIGSVFLVIVVQYSLAHEEPAKTLGEKKEKKEMAERISRLRIKTAKASKYKIRDGKATDEKYTWLVTEYTLDGLIAWMELYDSNNVRTAKTLYEYDSVGNMITDMDVDSADIVTEKSEFVYDRMGRVISGSSVVSGEEDSKFIYQLNSDKNQVVFIKYLKSSEIEYRIDYIYRENPDMNNPAQIFKYIPEKDTLMSVTLTYFPSGKVNEKTVFGEDNKLMHKFIYQWNESGNRTEIRKTLPGEVIDFVQQFRYDENGNCIEIFVSDKYNHLKSKIEYEYFYH
ncbi:MAG: hypothetical protein FJY07_07615 [Bacteroidetes bacterium]|nr:hypothetical protein [Bacteroidota bacterium]